MILLILAIIPCTFSLMAVGAYIYFRSVAGFARALDQIELDEHQREIETKRLAAEAYIARKAEERAKAEEAKNEKKRKKNEK